MNGILWIPSSWGSLFVPDMVGNFSHWLPPKVLCLNIFIQSLPQWDDFWNSSWPKSIHSYSKLNPSLALIKLCYYEAHLCFHNSGDTYSMSAYTEHKICWNNKGSFSLETCTFLNSCYVIEITGDEQRLRPFKTRGKKVTVGVGWGIENVIQWTCKNNPTSSKIIF